MIDAMTVGQPACPGCGSPRATEALRVAGHAVLACLECALVYRWPAASDEPAAYPADYYTHRAAAFRPGRGQALRSLALQRYYGYPGPPAGALAGFAALLLRPLRGYWRTIPPYAPGGRLLDAGCGSGLYLTRLQALGWDVCGIEPDAGAGAQAQARGIAVVCAPFEAASWPDGSFDVITFWHTLEHMARPGEALALALRLLRPGGLIMIESPNWASLQRRLCGEHWFHLDLPRHRTHFSPACLAFYLRRAGFVATRVYSVPSPIGATGSLERKLAARGVTPGWRHNLILKGATWLPEAALSHAGLAGCLMATARKP